MKNTFFKLLALVAVLCWGSCKNDHDDPEYDYHAHIHSPTSDAKNVGDVLHIEVEFESHTGETVHHVNVRIYNKADNTEIYNKPDDPHVHETSGTYEYTDDFTLSGISGNTDWVLEASVWGHEDNEEKVTESVEFHVN